MREINSARRLLPIVITLALVVVGIVVYLVYPQTKPGTTTTPAAEPTPSTQPSQQGTSNETPADQTEPAPINVKVYFSKHPESDDDPSKTFPVARTAPDLAVGKYVIEQLLVGPSESEKTAGYFSMVRVRDTTSNCQGRDFSLSIKDRVATLKFCRTFDALGTVSDGQAKSTITDSLLQFPTIDKVIILTPEGHCQFDMSGEDRCLQ